MRRKEPMKLVFAALVAVCMAMSPTTSFADEPSKRAGELYQEARKLLTTGDRDKAIEVLRAAVKLNPEFVEAHRDLINNQRDKAQEILKEYETYTEQNPESAVYRYLLGIALSAANKRDEADAEFEKALELDPDFGWSYLGAGSAYSRKGDRDKAVATWRKGLKRAGNSTVLRMAFANNLLANREYDDAREEAGRVLKINPEEFAAYSIRWRAELNETLGSKESREKVLKEIRALETDHSKNLPALEVVSSGYQMLDETGEHQRVRDSILAIDPEFYNRRPYYFSIGTPSGKMVRLEGMQARRLAETYSSSNKDSDQKLRILTQLEKEIEDPDARLYGIYPEMFRAHISKQDFKSARRVYELLEEGMSGDWSLGRFQTDLAQALVSAKTDLDLALSLTERAVSQIGKAGETKSMSDYQKGSLARAHQVRGNALMAKGDAEKAVEALGESVKVSRYESNSLDLGLAYARLGQRQKASEELAFAYAFEGDRNSEAEAALKENYSADGTGVKLDRFIAHAVEKRRAELLEGSVKKALAEMEKTEVKPAPVFDLEDLSGGRTRLEDLRGKVVLLNFWATWCGPCIQEFPHLQAIQNEFSDRGVVVLMVSVDSERFKVRPFLEKREVSANMLMSDGKVDTEYGVQGIPLTLILDREGMVRYRKTGYGPGGENELRGVIKMLVDENESANASRAN